MGIGYRLREATAHAAILVLKSTGFYDGYWSPWRIRLFDWAEARGLHILPVHYYSPVPRVSVAVRRPRPGLTLDVERSAAVFTHLAGKYDTELAALFDQPAKGPTDYDPANSAFCPMDAAALYAMVRERRPQRIIEIGSGSSTLVTAAAIRANQREDSAYRPHFACIEPYLPDYLKDGPAEVSEFLEIPLQDVPLERFTDLGENDILFIDSTHVVSFGSDVVYEYLTILPALAHGVLVHIHDIFLPSDYPERWLTEHRFFWNEQYLLEAFLAMNPAYRIELGVHAAAGVADPMPSIAAHPSDVFPASFWMSRI